MSDAQLPAKPIDPAAQVYAWIVAGASEDQISQAVKTLWPDRSPRPLLVAAMKRIADAAQADGESVKGWCIEATRAVYQKALEAGEHADALRAVNQLRALTEK